MGSPPSCSPGILLLSGSEGITLSDRESFRISYHGGVFITHLDIVTEIKKAHLSMVNSRGLPKV
nr:MAG: hypothetical protein AM324_06440 [Candidatus Thorarchaeota archaeon SMTZ1-83]